MYARTMLKDIVFTNMKTNYFLRSSLYPIFIKHMVQTLLCMFYIPCYYLQILAVLHPLHHSSLYSIFLLPSIQFTVGFAPNFVAKIVDKCEEVWYDDRFEMGEEIEYISKIINMTSKDLLKHKNIQPVFLSIESCCK